MKLSQLRQDLVSGDWIVVAPERKHSLKRSPQRKRAPLASCPFEDPRSIDHSEPILQVNDPRRGWKLIIVANKFPAFVHRDVCPTVGNVGPYAVTDGIGHHDIVITRDHHRDFSSLTRENAREVFQAFQDRCLMLMNDRCLAYIAMFHNWGPSAGATVYHPHYQLVAIPVVPPDFEHSLRGSQAYFRKHRTCVHCAMVAWERKEKKRMLFENEAAVAFTPFVSRSPFEIRVFPKFHLPFFENTPERDLASVVEALQVSLKMVKTSLKDPDYNFFIHTAPMRHKEKYKNYHWHIEVLPKVSVPAGFELGTGIEINPMDPNQAARILRRRG